MTEIENMAVVRLSLGENITLTRSGQGLLVVQNQVVGTALALDPPFVFPRGSNDQEIIEAYREEFEG